MYSLVSHFFQVSIHYLQCILAYVRCQKYFFFRVALTGPRSVAIYRLHPCSHWPLFAIAPTHEWIGNGANQTCTWAIYTLYRESWIHFHGLNFMFEVMVQSVLYTLSHQLALTKSQSCLSPKLKKLSSKSSKSPLLT